LTRRRALDSTLAARARRAAGTGPTALGARRTDGGLRHPRVSVVIPALNEAENLPFVLPHIPLDVDEVILVDGRSTDGTVELAHRLRPDVRVVWQSGKGKGNALRSGFEACSGDIIVMLDADGSTDPREIPRYVGALLSGADFAKGSRFLQGGGTADMTLHRRLGNKMFVLLVRLFFGGSYSDLCYGYNAFWADVPGQLDLEASGFEIETMMNIRALRAGLQVVEVPSFEHERIHGEGRLRTIPDGWRVLKTILSERFKRRKPAVLRELARPPIEPERLGRELARPSIEPERLEGEIG
jgi:glycosyltransferase involved in cell wall biosynthesis